MSDEYINCPNCPNQGWWVDANPYTGEPEQVQCEFCETEENSVFSVIRKQDERIQELEQQNEFLTNAKDEMVQRACADYELAIAELKQQLASANAVTLAILQVTEAMREWIDAVPSETKLPAMPGFDRDWADEVLTKLTEFV